MKKYIKKNQYNKLVNYYDYWLSVYSIINRNIGSRCRVKGNYVIIDGQKVIERNKKLPLCKIYGKKLCYNCPLKYNKNNIQIIYRQLINSITLSINNGRIIPELSLSIKLWLDQIKYELRYLTYNKKDII